MGYELVQLTQYLWCKFRNDRNDGVVVCIGQQVQNKVLSI